MFAKKLAHLASLVSLVMLFNEAFQAELFAWGMDTHRLITENALKALPDSDLSTLDIYADSLFILFCLYPDRYRYHERYPGIKEKIEKYHIIPNMSSDVLHGNNSVGSNDEQTLILMSHYFEQSINELKRGNIRDAACYMGVITHFIEDSNCPVHNTNNNLLMQLYPPPNRFEYFKVHRYVERPSIRDYELGHYTPQRLGTTVREAAYAILPKFEQIRLVGRAHVLSILRGIYENDFKTSNEARKKAIDPAVKLLADMYHTILCITREK
jgi:hypothetical protein